MAQMPDARNYRQANRSRRTPPGGYRERYSRRARSAPWSPKRSPIGRGAKVFFLVVIGGIVLFTSWELFLILVMLAVIFFVATKED